MKGTILTLLCCGMMTSSFAQKHISNQDLVWITYGLKVPLQNNWHFKQDIHERAYWFPWRQHQLLVRSSFNKKLNQSLTLGGGFTYFLQSTPQNPEVRNYIDYIELRPHLAAKLDYQINAWSMTQRLKTEFRFFEKDDGIPYSHTRVRYLLKAKRSITEHWSVHLFDELHMNIGSNIVLNSFDQNRLGAGITYKISDQLNLGLTYFNWYQQTSRGTDYVVRDIVQFSFNQLITR